VFFLSITFLLYFLSLFRNGVPQTFVLFWIPAGLAFVALLYQILRFGNEKWWQWLILFETMLVVFICKVSLMILSNRALLQSDDDYRCWTALMQDKGLSG